MGKKDFFTRFTDSIACWCGSPPAFCAAVLLIVGWGVTGPVFGFSDTWQIVINTATTIITFLLVFVIQHTQNRDSKALHLKINELIRATSGTHSTLLDLEELSEEELELMHKRYGELAEKARKRMREGKSDTGTMPIVIKK